MAFEECNDLVDGLQKTVRFRFEGKCNQPASACPQSHEVRHVPKKMVDHQWHIVGPVQCRLERAGNGAHAAFDGTVARQQIGQQIGQQVRVAQPLRVAPIWQVHLLLHARSMEGPVGETIDGEDIHPVADEEVPKFGKRGRGRQLGSGACRKPQAHAEIAGGYQSVAHRQHMLAKVGAHFSPRLPGVDVAAVGEMDTRAQVQLPTSRRRNQANARRISCTSI